MFKKLPIKQMLKIVKAHSLISVLLFFIGIFAAVAVFGTGTGKIIFSVIAMLLYFMVVYSEAYDVAKRDKKKTTKEEAYILKGFLLPILLVAITLVLYAGYYISWKYMLNASGILSVVRWIIHFAFLIWSFPFNTIINPVEGLIEWYGFILLVLVPVVFSGIGYLAGFKNFDISEKLSKFIYESKEENKKK